MSGTDSTKIIYWDACIYLAWLIPQQEQTYGAEALDAIRQIAREAYERKATIITSALTFVEVLSASLTSDAERQFRKSFKSLDHTVHDLTPPIAMKARDFRQNATAKGRSLKTPDAIHLATAAVYKAEFWTFDGQLLGLNGNELIDFLPVRRPIAVQPNLPS